MDMTTILVVEDEPMIRMLAADMLDVLGLGVVEAGDVDEALALHAEGASFEAAMIDLGLPGRPGEDLIEEMQRLKPEMPIIVTTGRDESELADRPQGGPMVFLGKPYQLADLEAALQQLNLTA